MLTTKRKVLLLLVVSFCLLVLLFWKGYKLVPSQRFSSASQVSISQTPGRATISIPTTISLNGDTSSPDTTMISINGATSSPATTTVSTNGATSSPATTTVSINEATSSPDTSARTTISKNPGCVSKKLDKYKPFDTAGVVYHHPPVVQYAKLSTGGSTGSLSFMDYMSMMSAYKLLKPEKIIILTYTDIIGKYWNLAQKWVNVSVQVKKIEHVSIMGGKHMVIQHQADFTKLRSLLEFGGVISDFDVIIVNGTKLKHMQRISECVLSREGDYINSGFSSCVRNSSFIREWLDTYYKDYRSQFWLHNSAFKPKDILEEKNTDVCHNMYLVGDIATDPTYPHAEERWLKKDGVKWQAKVAAHYFSKHMRQFDETVLEKDHSFGQMLKFITSLDN